MSKAFDTVNIHTQTNIPHTIIKYIANYQIHRKAYTTFRNKTTTQRQFKDGAPQGITITSTYNDLNKRNIQSYLHEIHTWTQTNNLILNPDKTTCTLFTPYPAEYSTQPELQIDNITLLLLSTHSHDPCWWGESDVPACGPPASFSVHLASSAVTPAGSVHKSRGDNVVRMWVQLKR